MEKEKKDEEGGEGKKRRRRRGKKKKVEGKETASPRGPLAEPAAAGTMDRARPAPPAAQEPPRRSRSRGTIARSVLGLRAGSGSHTDLWRCLAWAGLPCVDPGHPSEHLPPSASPRSSVAIKSS